MWQGWLLPSLDKKNGIKEMARRPFHQSSVVVLPSLDGLIHCRVKLAYLGYLVNSHLRRQAFYGSGQMRAEPHPP
ncbi:hypothetical protein EEJ34_17540 [Vibrio cholerae]|nr:hypothetical protein EEJ34_17540 [Vibrio cholerae]TXY23085.1 hypothetical protein FXE90_10720 [Vibrio cholerae]